MKSNHDLNSVIYHMIIIQIELGAYQFDDHLPYIKEMSEYFQVSPETIRFAYNKLKESHYITLSKNTGAKVIVNYSQDEIQEHIQEFFSKRKEALIDLGQSMQPLFSHIQWLSFQNASEQSLSELEELITKGDNFIAYRAINIFLKLFSFLKNDVFIRLVWWIFIFYQIPFFSIYKNIPILEKNGYLLLDMIKLCRQQKWTELKTTIDESHQHIQDVLLQFYQENIHDSSTHEKIIFSWDIYKRNEQKQYSLGTDIIRELCRGQYTENSFLPSLESLAVTKGVSVSTVRRTLTILKQIGAVQSINGVGTQVLPVNQITKNFDFSQKSIKKRLTHYIQSLYILANSCQEITIVTFQNMNEEYINQLIQLLEKLRTIHRCELAAYPILEYVSQYAPYQSIKTIYSQLFEQLLWGYPLYGVIEVPHDETIYIDTLIECLQAKNISLFSQIVEYLMINALITASSYLEKKGIATHINIPSLYIENPIEKLEINIDF